MARELYNRKRQNGKKNMGRMKETISSLTNILQMCG